MTSNQTAINASCARWLADLLERWGVDDTTARAEWITGDLIAQGLAPVPKPFPLRSTGPTSTAEGRARARAEFERIRAERTATDDDRPAAADTAGGTDA